MAVRASVLANGRVSPASLIRVATKAIETLTLLAKLKVVGQSDRPNRIVGFEFGYVALAALWFKHESKTTTAFIQHGFLNRFQTPIAFDKFYLNLEWDRKWIESSNT